MPWIPEFVPRTLLAPVSTPWNKWVDGESLDTAPHHKPPEVFACRILKTLKDPNGIQYKKGMEGQFLGMSDKHPDMARIFIQGVTEGDGFTNRVFPRQHLEIGKPWKSDIHDWHLTVNLETKRFDPDDWKQDSQPDDTVFSKTVVCLVEAFVTAPPEYATPLLIAYLDKIQVEPVSRRIIDGVKKAGLYTLLSGSQSFTVHDLMAKAKLKFPGRSRETQGGVYARFHVSNDKVTQWKREKTYLYTGKSVDFEGRARSHPTAQSVYGDLTRNSTFVSMFALCILSDHEERGMYLLCEQVFVCLFQTYRPNVLSSTVTNTEFLKHMQPARHFTDLATAVFNATGWQSGVSHERFGVDYGANWSSPLMEMVAIWERTLFIRTDANIKDGKTGKVVPMAFYHKSNPSKQRRDGISTQTQSLLSVYQVKDNKLRSIVNFSFQVNANTQASQWPLKGTFYELVIEVCKDGSQHPYAWARLPDIGSFKNSTQANSFAVRVEWQDPPESGNWRFNYARAGVQFKIVDDQIPGSLPTHARAISFLHWLTNSGHKHNQAWVPRASGCARVLQAKYNLMDQSIRFLEQDKDIKMHPGTALSTTAIEALMRKPEYDLQNVGTLFGGGKSAPGRRCDVCARLGRVYQCIQYKNTRGCTTCVHHFGRYVCSYTPEKGTSARKTAPKRTPEEIAAAAAVEKALICQPNFALTLPTFRQTLRFFENSEQMKEDASDVEADTEPDVEIS